MPTLKVLIISASTDQTSIEKNNKKQRTLFFLCLVTCLQCEL